MATIHPEGLKLLSAALDPFEGESPAPRWLVANAIELAANELEFIAYGVANDGAMLDRTILTNILHGFEARLRVLAKVAQQQARGVARDEHVEDAIDQAAEE